MKNLIAKVLLTTTVLGVTALPSDATFMPTDHDRKMPYPTCGYMRKPCWDFMKRYKCDRYGTIRPTLFQKFEFSVVNRSKKAVDFTYKRRHYSLSPGQVIRLDGELTFSRYGICMFGLGTPSYPWISYSYKDSDNDAAPELEQIPIDKYSRYVFLDNPDDKLIFYSDYTRKAKPIK